MSQTPMPIFVSTKWLAEHLEDENLMIVEASVLFNRSSAPTLQSAKAAYQQAHIPGAHFIDLMDVNKMDGAILFTVDRKHRRMKAALEAAGATDDTQIVVYDRGAMGDAPTLHADMWAARFRWQCQLEGITNVHILDGGLSKWQLEKRPVTDEVSTVTPGQLTEQSEQVERYATVEDVRVASQRDTAGVIDALSPDQYLGQVCPFEEERAGHIPNAKNCFFGSLTDPNTGALLPVDILKKKMEALGFTDSSQPLITYCGFGIAAAYLAQILEVIGYHHVAVYDGSLQEWALETNEPLAKEDVNER
ncbi:MAG: rhodanese-like domain-containing protein [Aerococcus sp.]|nr:rhodanese-like domain-containing protein [Aerococcus sp.]